MIGLESAVGLVSGLEVLRLEGIRWVGEDFGGLSGSSGADGILLAQLLSSDVQLGQLC